MECNGDGSHAVKRKDEVKVNKTEGAYINKANNLIGVYASKTGPVLIINDDQYVLKNGNWEFDAKRITSEENVFTPTKDGVSVFELIYPTIEFVDYDPWSSEDDVDFFLWLSKSANRYSYIDDFPL